MKLLKEIHAPTSLEDITHKCKAKWFTWSDDLLSFQDQIEKEFQKYGQPEILPFFGMAKAESYNVDLQRINGVFSKKISEFSTYLTKIKIKEEVHFFDNLICDGFSSDTFRFFFSCLRASLSTRRSDGMASLYIPIGEVKGSNEFPVHSDLYIPTYLWNIFDEILVGDNGCPLLLPVDVLLNKVIKEIKNFPDDKYEYIKSVFHERVLYNEDKYMELISLLHGKENWWYEEMKEKINKYVFKIKFGRGQGYLINDRKWLHGRSFSTEGVTSKRLHRLVF